MPIYESEFPGAAIDARLAAVATMQTAISNLETAVAAKYSKPANGIPETDLDASVEAALALARTAVQSLSDYYTKAQVDDITAAIAASVDSTPGVVVTTLPSAGAGTLGKIYYVGPDANGFYDRYVTSYDGSTYSWLALGNTEVDMTQYATKDELNQLGQEVTDLVQPRANVDFAISDESGLEIVRFAGGEIQTKKFDSAATPNTETSEDADLDVADEDGNTLARFKDGNVQVRNFDSADLAGVVGRYAGKRLSILGDSISTFGTPSADNEDGDYCYSYYPATSCRYSEDGVDSIEFDVQDTYWMKLIIKAKMILGVNDSYRGTCVSGTTNAMNLQTRINHLGLNGSPDVILVFGGTNDAGADVTVGTFNTEDPSGYTAAQIAALPVTTFADAYRAMLIRLMKTYPYAEIVVVLPTFTASYYTITNLDLYVEVIKEACDFFGIKYIDARCTGINIYNKAAYLVDGIHPNKDGMSLLFNKIYKQLIFN